MSTGEPSKAVLRSKKTVKKTAIKASASKNTNKKSVVVAVRAKKTVKKKVAPTATKKQTSPFFKKVTSSTSVNPAKKVTDQLAIPASRGLMLLSPLRFPLDVDKIAVQTATYAGAFFVAIGAILTMWHSTLVYSSVPPMSFMAQVLLNDRTTTFIEPVSTLNQNVQPDVYADISVAFNFIPTEPLQGDSVHVQVELPGETEYAYLFARDTKSGATIDFGSFSYFSGSIAETYIDVTDVSDGTYRFYVIASYYTEQTGDYTITVTDTKNQRVYAPIEDEEMYDTEEAYDLSDDEIYEEPASEVEAVREKTILTDPEITIVLPSDRLTGKANLAVTVEGATYVEIYALQENTGTQRYVGLPRKTGTDTWNLVVDTSNLPNGMYRFVASVRTNYGFFTKRSSSFSIYNETVTITDAAALDYQAKAIELMQRAMVDISLFGNANESAPTPLEQLDRLVAAQTNDRASSSRTILEENYGAVMEQHRHILEEAFQILAVAERAGIQDQIDAAMERIFSLVDSFNIEDAELLEFTKGEIEQRTARIAEDVKITNKIIVERTGLAAETDSDRDGITDFDEIVIYKTDPHVADSDGDGFTDGAEVLSGFNPTDSTPQVPVAYESPRAEGIVRDDLLSVDSIATEAVSETKTDSPVAIITGTSLPNSFVTLYIFSTPIVVTVRTNYEGNWIYRFDKELEDGEHQIYAGITDNAGKIVAKSNPLSFIKVAQAYEQVNPPAPGALTGSVSDNSETYSMISLILVTASISVVAIGLILILLGVHLDGRGRREIIKAAESA